VRDGLQERSAGSGAAAIAAGEASPGRRSQAEAPAGICEIDALPRLIAITAIIRGDGNAIDGPGTILCLALPLTPAMKEADDENAREQEKQEMATATEMTLALGRTVYGGDPSGEIDSDERIEGRETRLSVTWRLTEEEQDLTLMASVLAEEAERALKQADRTVCKGPSPKESYDIEGISHSNNKPKPDANINRFTAERQPTTGASPEDAPASNENGHSPEHSPQPASSYPPTGSGQAIPHQNGGKLPTTNGSSGYRVYVPPITKPQQLAIQSHCTRHGVADWELRRLLWEMFGKKEPRELSKEQAGELLTALQRDILSSAAESSAYAN